MLVFVTICSDAVIRYRPLGEMRTLLRFRPHVVLETNDVRHVLLIVPRVLPIRGQSPIRSTKETCEYDGRETRRSGHACDSASCALDDFSDRSAYTGRRAAADHRHAGFARRHHYGRQPLPAATAAKI